MIGSMKVGRDRERGKSVSARDTVSVDGRSDRCYTMLGRYLKAEQLTEQMFPSRYAVFARY